MIFFSKTIEKTRLDYLEDNMQLAKIVLWQRVTQLSCFLAMSHFRLSRRLCPFRPYSRPFAAISSNSPPATLNTVGPYQVFDRSAKIIQRDNAARRESGTKSRTVDYVRDEVAERMLERFMVCPTYGFSNVRSCTMLNTIRWGYQKEIRNCCWLRLRPRTFLEIVRNRQSPEIHYARFQR